ncbi:MAG: TonB-dependent receptor [Agarilytica sp.]
MSKKSLKPIYLAMLKYALGPGLSQPALTGEISANQASPESRQQVAPSVHFFDIPAQSLDTALIQLGLQSATNIIYASDVMAGVGASPLVGYFELEQALNLLLLNTAFEFEFSSSKKSIVIHQKGSLPKNDNAETELENTPADTYEEVLVVSARRREESLFDVPIAVSVVSATEIGKKGFQNSVALSGQFPNTKVKLIRGTNSTMTAFIRGVGHEDPLAGVENSIGFYLDDIYINRPQGLLSELYFIDRVEVLRGPQGTLYGRNTVGGAVKYTSRAVAEDKAFEFRSRFGSYYLRELGLYASTPMERLNSKVSISLSSIQRDGFGKNNTTGEGNYDKDIFSLRGQYQFQPSETFVLRTSVDYSEDNSTAIAGYDALQGDGGDKYDTAAGSGQTGHPIDTFKMESYGVSTHIDISENEHTNFKAIMAYRFDDTASPIDFDSREEDALDVFVEYENEQASLELQHFYGVGDFEILTGAYSLKSTASNAFDTVFGDPGVISFTSGEIDLTTRAVFSDMSYALSSSWKLGFGFRYTQEIKKVHINRDLFVAVDDSALISPHFGGDTRSIVSPIYDGAGNEIVPNFYGERKDIVFTPKVNLSWKANRFSLLYFSYQEGFKGGGFDPRGDYSQTPVRRGYRPENIESYELGYRLSQKGGGTFAEIAAFHNVYSDIQIQGGFAFPGAGDEEGQNIPTITNAASAEINGIELHSRWEFIPTYSIDFELGLLNSRYKKFIDASGANVAKSRHLPHSPDKNVSLTLEHYRNIWSGGMSFYFNSTFQSKTQHLNVAVDGFDQDGYSIENTGVSWENGKENMLVGVHVTNLFDERYSIALYDFPNALSVFYGEPRQMHISFSIKY